MLRTMRTKKEITLRELAENSDIDVAYLSRVERATIPPPQKEEILNAINEALNLSEEEAESFRDQSAIDNEHFPKDIAKDIKDIVGIPLLLRTVANKKMTEEQIRKVTAFINERY
jgi:transcriptional regulator with XRE-family HTH domain